MNTNTLLVESPVVFNMLDNSERGSEAARAVLLLNAARGRFTEPVESITEADLFNPEAHLTTADLDAFHEDMREYFESGAYAEDLDAMMREDY